MLMQPPKSISKYLAVNNDGNWVSSSDMPKELSKVFEDFVRDLKEAENWKWGLLADAENKAPPK
jgi:hypothetical protein